MSATAYVVRAYWPLVHSRDFLKVEVFLSPQADSFFYKHHNSPNAVLSSKRKMNGQRRMRNILLGTNQENSGDYLFFLLLAVGLYLTLCLAAVILGLSATAVARDHQSKIAIAHNRAASLALNQLPCRFSAVQ
jgi:hypothetical protein